MSHSFRFALQKKLFLLTDLVNTLVIHARGFRLEGKGDRDGLFQAGAALIGHMPSLVKSFVRIIECKFPRSIKTGPVSP